MAGLDRLDVLVAGGAYAQEFGRRLPVYQEHRRQGFLGARGIGTTAHDRRLALTAVTELAALDEGRARLAGHD